MLNVLSYIGVTLQSELCLWTLLGLIRTIFDATLFKVNANLKQVWQMSMPQQLSVPVQQCTRTIISGVMLVQCFTVYVYLASYIVLLYPVFLEERPTLLLPWLLLAAIRSFLCELTSLALGLGACVLLGAARPPCIKFVVFKVASIMPAFYMWILVYCYYDMLKVASTYKQRFPATLSMMPSDHDYGLELAVRRRRTKSLQDENQLRKKLVASFNYGERSQSSTKPFKADVTVRMVHSTNADFEGIQEDLKNSFTLTPLPPETKTSDIQTGSYEDWSGNEIIVPRDSDRILEQFSVMMLRIAAWLSAEPRCSDPAKLFNSNSSEQVKQNNKGSTSSLRGSAPPNKMGGTVSYLQNFPQTKTTEGKNKSTLNDTQPAERALPKDKSSVKKMSSENVAKEILEPTAEGQKYAELQNTDSSAHKQSSQKPPSIIKNARTTSHVRYDTDPRAKGVHDNSQEPQREDSGLQIGRKKDKSEELERIIKISSEEYASLQSSKHTIQSQTSQTSPTNLEMIQERIKMNAALLQEQQRQEQNENTDIAKKPSSTRTLKRTNSK